MYKFYTAIESFIANNANELLRMSARQFVSRLSTVMVQYVEAISTPGDVNNLYSDLIDRVTADCETLAFSDDAIILTDEQFVSMIVRSTFRLIGMNRAMATVTSYVYGKFLFDEEFRQYAYGCWMNFVRTVIELVA